MKICLIGPGIMSIPPEGWGAVEILIWDYYLELKNKNIDATIINKIRNNHIEQTNINSNYCQDLINEINSGNYDFVHIHYDVLFHISDYLNCKVGLTSHYPYINDKNKHNLDGFTNIFNYIINTKHLNLVLSKIDKQFLEENGAKDCLLLENGISTNLFKFSKNPQKEDRTIYLGKISNRKNQHKFCHLDNIDIIGPGGEGLKNWKGAWNREDVHNKLSDYGNMLLISSGEADPLVIKEALTCGLGVVVNQSSAKNLENKSFITIIPEDKLNDFCFIQNQIDNNRKISIKLRSEIKRYGEEKYGFNNLINNYLNIIKKNLKKKINEGYFVMGFGKKYIDECEKIVQTLRVFDSSRPVALMTHRKDEKYVETKSIFNDIIYVDEEDIKDDNIHNSFCVKPRIHMPKYMPYDKIISLDSDMTCIHNPQHAWDFFNNTKKPFMCSGYDYEKCWHWGYVDNVISKVGKKIPSIHGGVLYFNKTHKDINLFYDYSKDALNNYDNYNCLRVFRGGMTDEIIFSIAMAKLDILPLNYEKYPIVSFNLPISIELPAFIQSREGEDTKKHIITKYPTIFNHLFFHEKSTPKERQIKLERWYNVFHKKISLMNNFVCVTALYNIGRKDRNFEFYIENTKKLLQFKMPLIIFCNKSTYNKLKDIKREYYTQFIVREFEELDFYKKHYHEIKENISKDEYKNNVKHYGRPETVYPEYNIIQYSKFDFLFEVKNIINSQHYIWIDAGVPRFFNDIPKNKWPNYKKLNDKIIVQTFRENEIKDKFKCNFNEITNNIKLKNECKMSRYLIIGTTFVVPNKDVEWLRNNINEKYREMLDYGFLNNEQVALEFVVKENMERFDIKINNSNNWYNMMEYI